MSDEDDLAVRSEPVTTDEGEEVVIRQQNVGPGNQVGGGEFKNVERGKSPDEAAAEQEALARGAPTAVDETDDIQALHRQLLDAWNERDAVAYTDLFATDGTIVGFDGSTVDGRDEIRSHLSGIFADHATGSYVGAVRGARLLGPDVGILRAVTGLIPDGEEDVNPATNAIQSLIAVRVDGDWRVALFQNTPAAFHGRPEAADALTDELRQLARGDQR
jgi:uncharacterized protein (TIGR02246 family)